MINPWKPGLFIVIILLVASSCSQHKNEKVISVFEVRDFKTLTNWKNMSSDQEHLKLIYLDYTNAINGFAIPSESQTPDGMFHFEFSIKNLTSQAQKFYYKIYYQNETYKFPEVAPCGKREHINAAENFYGSWDIPGVTYAITQEIPADTIFHRVSFKLRIIGNPRFEKQANGSLVNEPWQRNPRTGQYSFMLVVTTKDNVQQKIIPDHISDIALKRAGLFHNPYYYFLFGKGSELKDVFVSNPVNELQVIAKPDLSSGIYTNPNDFDPQKYSSYYTSNCGSNEMLYRNAPLQQFINYVHASSKIDNIPVIADVLGDNYSQRDYNWNRTFYKKEELISILPSTADCPCEGTYVDSLTHNIIIRNKASGEGDLHKQSTGVITRHGFTYGKYTVKVKLTELLNKNGIWNGITNAIWLISQSDEPWNRCRECYKKGYLSQYWGGKDDKRSPFTSYSEIDFEILKTVSYCPLWQFPPAYIYPVPDKKRQAWWDVPLPENMMKDSGKVMVCCTNWDMACPQPAKYDVGCQPIAYDNQTFVAHRWDYWYRALTQRTPASDDEMFAAPYYYFQIEWKPTEIIWRIGPEKNQFRVVGYMNDQITSIPNNQMKLIISQEFHSTQWWPGSPYEQQFIPFPQNDIIGRIMEITVE